MKICLVAEGSYPYVQGGVSSWVDSLITRMPEHEFVIQTIAANRSESGKFKYELPANISDVSEAFLSDDDIVDKHSKLRLSRAERQAVRSLLFCEDERWEVIFDMFASRTISLNELLMGPEFYEAVLEFYNERYDRVVFTDFLWTCRSAFLPIFTVLKNCIPEADAYHSVSTGYAGVLAAYAGYIHKKPVLLTEHGIYTREREEEIIRASWTRGIYKDLWIAHFYMLSRCVYDRADRVFSLFERAREVQIELGCAKERTEVIHNGIQYNAYQSLAGKDAGDNHINVGTVARVTPIKDIKTMINAFHRAKERVPELRLYIIGSTEEDPDYYRECTELISMMRAEDIIFTGHVNVKEYIGKLDIFLLTSISEGQPLSVLEAMAAGKACVTTRVGDCFDMLNAGDPEGSAGIVVPVMNVGQIAEALVLLATDGSLRHTMGERGRRIVSRYYRDSGFIFRYKDIYKEFAR